MLTQTPHPTLCNSREFIGYGQLAGEQLQTEEVETTQGVAAMGTVVQPDALAWVDATTQRPLSARIGWGALQRFGSQE